jgi:hypothetical protein
MATGRVSGGRRSGGIAGGTRMNTTKNTSKGKAKVESRINRLNEIADYRSGGAVGYEYKKGKLKEIVENSGIKKVKPRNIKKVTDKMAPSSKKDYKKYKEQNKGTGPFKTPKVPVKRKSK